MDDVCQPGFLPCLEKPTQNGGMKPTPWNSIPRVFFRFAPMGKVEQVRFDLKGVFSFRHDGESRTQLDDVRQPGFLPCLEKPTQNGGMKPTSWNSILRVFFHFAPMGKFKQIRLNPIGRRSSTGFLPCLEKPTQNGGMKLTSWNSIPRVFFRFAPMGKVKQFVLNPIGRRSSTRLFALLGKAHSKW